MQSRHDRTSTVAIRTSTRPPRAAPTPPKPTSRIPQSECMTNFSSSQLATQKVANPFVVETSSLHNRYTPLILIQSVIVKTVCDDAFSTYLFIPHSTPVACADSPAAFAASCLLRLAVRHVLRPCFHSTEPGFVMVMQGRCWDHLWS